MRICSESANSRANVFAPDVRVGGAECYRSWARPRELRWNGELTVIRRYVLEMIALAPTSEGPARARRLIVPSLRRQIWPVRVGSHQIIAARRTDSDFVEQPGCSQFSPINAPREARGAGAPPPARHRRLYSGTRKGHIPLLNDVSYGFSSWNSVELTSELRGGTRRAHRPRVSRPFC
ncbi:hypothetical protein EVAR_43122_1 [Eumeta japonica]|uniref:Uncharacterized protein n=1 Tax=Eumeta variegata TaxID=151549 RepID=A0A4C1XS21_EUMVA|nr:hypothetical protein EVAR_43122_1 [Eumeta japonica]